MKDTDLISSVDLERLNLKSLLNVKGGVEANTEVKDNTATDSQYRDSDNNDTFEDHTK